MDEQNNTTAASVTCPDCGSQVEISLEEGMEPEIGDVVVCQNCGAELEVIETNPLEVDYLMVQK